MLFTKKKINLLEYYLIFNNLGYSTSQMVITIVIIGIISTIIIPKFNPAIEFIEILMAEKYLLNSVRECQLSIVNYDSKPQYSPPQDDLKIGIFKREKYIFSYTGILGDCYPQEGGNIISISQINNIDNVQNFSLMINVVNGEKTFEGKLPNWLNWWQGNFSPIIPENDTYFLQ